MHEEITRVLFALALVLLLARLAGQVATAWKLPPVLGELTVGILVGNLTLLHIDAFAWATTLLGSGPVLDPGNYAALILTVFATTIVTPPLLARALERAQFNHSTEASTPAPSTSERS